MCHGWAGLVLTTWRAAADADPGSELAAAMPRLRTRMDQRLHIDAPLGTGGLLEGEAGLRLAEHTVDTGRPDTTRWDLCLLLSG
ncbi:MAG TPA: hypothetical protein VM677_21080 [Actinokineospora sp.]|nr:hypothetical protein [Actinokineospora sp.]